MSREKHMTRREALRKMGGATAGGMGLVIAAANAADVPGLSNSAHKERKMKALAINGSSRKDGNTADMLNVVLAELGKEGYETEHVQLAGSTVNACKACFGCAGRGNCVFGNDIFQELYDKMVKADAIILGSSTYSADVSSTLKAVIERASVVSDTNPGCGCPPCRGHERDRHDQPFLPEQGNVCCRLYLLEHRLWPSAR